MSDEVGYVRYSLSRNLLMRRVEGLQQLDAVHREVAVQMREAMAEWRGLRLFLLSTVVKGGGGALDWLGVWPAAASPSVL